MNRLVANPFRIPGHEKGSAIVAVLGVLALLTLLLVSMLHGIRMERKTASASAAEVQARLAADSGVAAAMTRLQTCARGYPAFLVGLRNDPDADPARETAPALVAGASNLTSASQMIPLFSCDPKPLASWPKLPSDYLPSQLALRLSTNPNETTDLNDPSLENHETNGTETNMPRGGLLAAEGRFPALWQYLRDADGKVVGRYAYVLTDESARLNPSLHRGMARTDPTDWDKGPGSLPMTNASATLFTGEEADGLRGEADLPTTGSLERAFPDPDSFGEKHHHLTLDPCLLPELIPPGLPEAGFPKYNLNDLATNPAWGATPYARATNIAGVIDRNLSNFKFRDPSLSSRQAGLYLIRLACSIVDYISPSPGATGPAPDEPLGRDLAPYVTQIAELCTRTSLTETNVTVESRFFAEIWNPTTSVIPAGGIATLSITNRARLRFGRGIEFPFRDYRENSPPLPVIRPNEFLVVAFPPENQTWESPVPTKDPPQWEAGPDGNANGNSHQAFALSWNGRTVDGSRREGISPGDVAGGLGHLRQTLDTPIPRWQCMTIPTWSANSDGKGEPTEADEALQPGSYRFVGDPRATFLTAYKWNPVTNYPAKTLWAGINPAGIMGRGFVLDPAATWIRRDRVPVDPVSGNPPSGALQTPDGIPSSYGSDRAGTVAPFVMRKGPMASLAELGNIFDPAQADDAGEAPKAGSPKATVFCSGGGRTLRIGQPEFHSDTRKYDWDVPGKRAVELIDLFTLRDRGRLPPGSPKLPDPGIPGRINVNTAPREVLETLFTGVAVTSDGRFTNSRISTKGVEELAALLEKNRPFSRLSDLRVLTTNLVNAETYVPRLSKNVPGSSPPIADVFDRAREEAFGKIIGHCAVQSRSFRIVVVGEALDRSGKTSARSCMEGVLHLSPDATGALFPSLHDVCRH